VSPPHGLPTEGLTATLVLVRHGQSTWIAEGRFQGRADPPLSALGEEQAALVAARLGGPRGSDPMAPTAPHALWSSPLGRARGTARHLAALPGWPPIRAADGLSEIGQGEWEGQPSAVVAARWPDLLAGWRRDPLAHHAPGGEALADVDVRIRAALEEILRDLPPVDGPDAAQSHAPAASPVPGYAPVATTRPWAVVVAHDGVLRLALLSLLGLPLGAFWRVPFVLCGITVVTIDRGATALRAHNLAGHLDAAIGRPEVARPGAL
jgi:probable phosphoglycerate mutase